MKEMRRVLALLLCFVLLVGYVPVGAFAAEAETVAAVEETVAAEEVVEAVIGEAVSAVKEDADSEQLTAEAEAAETVEEDIEAAFGEEVTASKEAATPAETLAAETAEVLEEVVAEDEEVYTEAEVDADYLFVATDRHANTSVIGNVIDNMESDIGENKLDYLALGGDMVGSGNDHPEYDSSVILAEVTGATSSLSAANVDIVAGIHDMNVNDNAGIVLPYQGGGARIYEGDRFYVYGVEEYCIAEESDSDNWSAQAAAFVSWANSVEDTSKAIIVVSHYPLHVKRNDNPGAVYWHNALNTVATGSETGTSVIRDVVFFHGHNHTVDSNEYVYTAGKDTLDIEGGSDDSAIYYTYATAGYLKANQNATLVTINDKTITLTKYGTSGNGTSMTTVTRVESDDTVTGDGVITEDNTVTASCTADGEANLDTVTAVGAGLTAVAAQWNDEAAENAAFSDCVAYDVTLTGYTEGDAVELTFCIDNMTAEDLVVYVNGEATTDFTATENEDGSLNVALTQSAAEATYIIGYAAVAETAALTGISVTAQPNVTNYTLVLDEAADGNLYLDITGLVITATYDNGETAAIEWNQYDETKNGYALSFDLSTAGTRTVTVTYGGFETSFEVTVYEATATDNSTDETVVAAVGSLLKEGFVSRDITVTGYTDGTDIKVIMPAPEGANIVYYVAEDGTVTEMKDADFTNGYVAFTTDHFSTYVVGEGTEIEVPDNETASGESTIPGEKKTVYVMSSSISSGNEYMIVNGNSAGTGYYALANNNGSVAATSVTIKSGDVDGDGDTETYIELDDATDELWTVSGSSTYNFKNGSYYLYSGRDGLRLDSDDRAWTYSNNKLYYNGDDDRFLSYNSGWTQTTSSSSATSIYFYIPQEVDTTTTVSGTYSIDGQDETVAAVKDATLDLTANLLFDGEVKEDVSATATYKVYKVTDENGNVTVNGDPLGVISSISGNTVTLSGNEGKALVKVSYTTEYGVITDYITITAAAPDHYGIQLHYADLTEVAADAEYDSSATYYVFNSTTNVYEAVEIDWFEEGTTYYTTPVVQGDEIDDVVALKGIAEGDRYPIWAVVKAYPTEDDTNGTDLGALGDALTWTVSDTSIATINTETGVLTFTGENYGTFTVTVYYTDADGETIYDTITISVTESLYVVPGDGTDDFPEYPSEGAIRFDKTASAVGNFSETGIALVELSMTGVPYSTGSEIDVVLMLDMTGSMSDTAMVAAEEAAVAFVAQIVKNEDGTYNDNRIAVYAFNSSSSSPFELVSLGTIDSDTELTAANTTIRTASDKKYSGGTPYDDALATCQSVLTAAKTTNLPEGVESADDYDRQQFCVFMSDGGPTSYEYITNYDAVKAGTATEYTHSSASATGGQNQSDSNFATIATYTHEYYSTLMKDDEVTMFSVLTGLSADDYPNCATILENIASSSDNAYVVENGSDTTAVSSALTSIAQKIVEAAKNVVVEDKVGNDYSVNLALPYNVTSSETDGLSEFYIQVVEYQLNSDKERTGDPYVKENFTFNADGSIKSHTVDGTQTCGSTCTHVTQSQVTKTYTKTEEDGTTSSVNYTVYVTTAIDGTYFSYKRVEETDEDGNTIDAEYLTWNEDKISSTELTLQYFVHLDNSSDAVGTDNEVSAAGTYYTNEYATLTYTNYNGNRVQQEFPIPQMTWNGAQVSYVFYLVNDAGQPVNHAGRVIPFAEAIYVTDVYTHEVIWNDLEQAAGLEADHLAENLVPAIYSLYDDDATYKIHVYEDEDKVNLNNHFTIGGDVTDDYNTVTHSWTNAKTTYVFNNKSDATKYNAASTYIANDDSDTSTATTYLCKGEGTVTATIEKVTVADAAAFTAGTYFVVNESGNYVQAASYDSTATYYAITSASYTVADGESQAPESSMESTSGATIISGYAYYIDENNQVYTIVQKSNGSEVHAGFDFANTTVAFAVVWNKSLTPDTVVVDYGLDVVVDVTRNDILSSSGVTGVRNDVPYVADEAVVMNTGTYTNNDKSTSAEISIKNADDTTTVIGTASVESTSEVRFSMNRNTGMQFHDPAVIYYEADCNYYDENVLKTATMYSSLTVIPATTIYYEDDFVSLKEYEMGEDGTYGDPTDGWYTVVSNDDYEQDADRPGYHQNMDAEFDADNVYGYDSAYDNCSQYSLNGYAMTHVDANSYSTAEFDFYGTGFDVISMTSNTTGTFVVRATKYNADGTLPTKATKSNSVDTYYGYNYGLYDVTYVCAVRWIGGAKTYEWTLLEAAEVNSSKTVVKTLEGYNENTMVYSGDLPTASAELNGTVVVSREMYWMQTNDTGNALYQIPVMKIDGLEYGKYHATIIATYSEWLDHTAADGYDLYLDAIRIYDPAGTEYGTGTGDDVIDQVIQDAYYADGEAEPEYYEVRNLIIAANDFDALTEGEQTTGAVFIDQSAQEYTVADYTSYGPNNELYLAPGNAVAFTLTVSGAADVQIGIKNANGVLNGELTLTTTGEKSGSTASIPSGTDRYYSIKNYVDLDGSTTIALSNTGDAGTVISVTNIKVSYGNQAVATAEVDEPITSSKESTAAVLKLMNASAAEEAEPEVTLDAELDVNIRKTSVKVGSSVVIKVTTSADVESLTVNGEAVTKYVQNSQTGKRSWTATVKAEEVGDLDITVTALDADGNQLDSETKTVEVTQTMATLASSVLESIISKLLR